MNLTGRLIEQKYQILHLLGQGGMGSVFAANDLSLNRKVAIKFLNPGLLEDESAHERFLREIKVLSELNHKNLVRIFAAGRLPEGIPYLLSEYIEAESLAKIIDINGALPWKKALSIIIQCAEALAYVHRHQIVHRDIKPQNILVLDSDQEDELSVKVLDFGLAKALGGKSASTLTESGEVLGSPHCISPEQCRGLQADERSDIYSLACVLYECLSGSFPFQASTPIEMMGKHIHEEAPSLLSYSLKEAIPQNLNAAVQKALQKEAGHRFQNMSEFAETLKQIRSGQTVYIDLSPPESEKRARKTGMAVILFVSLLLVLGLFAAKTDKSRRQSEQRSSTDEKITQISSIFNRLEKSDSKTMQSKDFSRAINLLIKQLSSVRNQKTTFAREMDLIEQSNKLIENRLSNLQGTLPELGGRINEAIKLQEGKNSHNQAELLCLMTGFNGYRKAEYLCRAYSLFLQSGNLEAAAAQLEKIKRAAALDQSQKLWVIMAEMETELKNNQSEKISSVTDEIVSELRKESWKSRSFEKAVALIRLAELNLRAKRPQVAETIAAAAIKDLSTDDGPLVEGLKILAKAQEMQGKNRETQLTYIRLKEAGLESMNSGLILNAQQEIIRLNHKQSKITEGKPTEDSSAVQPQRGLDDVLLQLGR